MFARPQSSWTTSVLARLAHTYELTFATRRPATSELRNEANLVKGSGPL